jgi:hypothetical protein
MGIPAGIGERAMKYGGEVDAAGEFADHRHDEVGHQGLDDLAERRADDHADGKVDHVAFDRELLEFGHHAPWVILVWRKAQSRSGGRLRQCDSEDGGL